VAPVPRVEGLGQAGVAQLGRAFGAQLEGAAPRGDEPFVPRIAPREECAVAADPRGAGDPSGGLVQACANKNEPTSQNVS
jgi:hypothetical protein